MTAGELQALVKTLAQIVRETVATEIGKATAEYERRIKALEAHPQMRYTGVYRAEKMYDAGSLCTDRGSLWYAAEATTIRPPGAPWQLVAKRGGDGGAER